jgi:hypothetical protein
MEFERLPLGPSRADKNRAAELRWRGKPPGLSPEMADEFMARIVAGETMFFDLAVGERAQSPSEERLSLFGSDLLRGTGLLRFRLKQLRIAELQGGGEAHPDSRHYSDWQSNKPSLVSDGLA